MNLLTKPPKSVLIDGVEIPINWDFRASIKYSALAQETIESATEDTVMSWEFVLSALETYYPTFDRTLEVQEFDIEKAYNLATWFFACGENEDEGDGKKSKDSRNQLLDYEHDADFIYAAFVGQYGIDLTECEDLHWWKFRALLGGLKEDEQFHKIMGYRSYDAGDFAKMDKEQRKFYKKMQKAHALPKRISAEEKELTERINAALKTGGDVAAILAERNTEPCQTAE